MPKPATTKMSSKGQVVIPEEIRQRLGLKPGVQFVVVGERDVVILKTIALPSMRQFDELVAEARRQARKEGMKRSDVVKAVAAARRQRSKSSWIQTSSSRASSSPALPTRISPPGGQAGWPWSCLPKSWTKTPEWVGASVASFPG